MLYGLYDMQHAALFPARVLAEATQNAFQNPFIPASYTRLGRTIAAGAELFERTTRRFGKPAFGLSVTRINGDAVAVREVPVLSKPFSFSELACAVQRAAPNAPRALCASKKDELRSATRRFS